MIDHLKPEDWQKEYESFMSAEPIEPPRWLSEKVKGMILADLNPPAWLVFSKLALIHAIVGSITLLFCPQFGISPFHGLGLMGILMRYGESACMAGCGAVFLGMSTLMTSLLLAPEQIKVIRRNELLQLSILALISMGVFICTGVGIVASLALFWLLGSVIGGLATLELGWVIRSRFRRRLPHDH